MQALSSLSDPPFPSCETILSFSPLPPHLVCLINVQINLKFLEIQEPDTSSCSLVVATLELEGNFICSVKLSLVILMLPLLFLPLGLE